MKRKLVALLVLFTVPSISLAVQYQKSSKVLQASWKAGAWDGNHEFHDVYCLKFPSSKKAFGMDQGFYNKNAIHITSVLYPEYLTIKIVASTLPKGRTESEEAKRLLETEKMAEKAYSHSYNIEQRPGAFGNVIGLRINNVLPKGKNGPFPLVRPIYNSKDGSIVSMSVHRIFVRGANRFEIAALQAAPKGAGDQAEKILRENLEKHVDEALRSFEQCTSKMTK